MLIGPIFIYDRQHGGLFRITQDIPGHLQGFQKVARFYDKDLPVFSFRYKLMTRHASLQWLIPVLRRCSPKRASTEQSAMRPLYRNRG
ncbi:hypothetical protein A6M27_18080 [Acidithiobacillus thiooxidans]|nr:hypothetical protein A6O26_10435 [Acidithiobacillus thiooxidans]OCX83011.1 hypothetical protein A6M27_18080 [Acidithiobacillus thiooxidans]